MTEVSYNPEGMSVRFPGWESVMVGRSAVFVPASAILAAQAEEGWTTEVLGFRRGLAVTGYRKLGTFTHPSGLKRLVSMKRGLPLLRVQVERGTTGFDELLLSTVDAVATAGDINGKGRE